MGEVCRRWILQGTTPYVSPTLIEIPIIPNCHSKAIKCDDLLTYKTNSKAFAAWAVACLHQLRRHMDVLDRFPIMYVAPEPYSTKGISIPRRFYPTRFESAFIVFRSELPANSHLITLLPHTNPDRKLSIHCSAKGIF